MLFVFNYPMVSALDLGCDLGSSLGFGSDVGRTQFFTGPEADEGPKLPSMCI